MAASCWNDRVAKGRRTANARGPLTVSEAVDALGVSQPAVTRTLGSLIALNLVETQRDASDSRIKRIRLTAIGPPTELSRSAVTKAWAGLIETLGGL